MAKKRSRMKRAKEKDVSQVAAKKVSFHEEEEDKKSIGD